MHPAPPRNEHALVSGQAYGTIIFLAPRGGCAICAIVTDHQKSLGGKEKIEEGILMRRVPPLVSVDPSYPPRGILVRSPICVMAMIIKVSTLNHTPRLFLRPPVYEKRMEEGIP